MFGFEHSCQRSEDAEAAARNLALFSHLSGENRARMGWPDSVRLRALMLTGEDVTAQRLADTYLDRLRRGPQRIEIPQQRKPIETRSRKTHHWGQLDKRYGRPEIPYSGA